MKLFSESVPFYKANFHCHTLRSDGRISPEEAMRRYREAGYDILSITDHRTVTLPDSAPEGLLMIPGIELDYVLPGQAVHILGLGMDKSIENEWNRGGTPQQGIDDIIRLGGLAVLAHPAWSLNTPAFMRGLKGVCGVEIWNSVSTLPYNADRADSSSLLDVAWSSGGPLWPVFANDDSHFYEAEAFVGATMVQTEALTRDGVMDALRAGRFYATQGPEIRQIEYGGEEVAVRTSPAEAVIFYSNCPWAGKRAVLGHELTESVYRVRPDERFIRVEVRDAEGRKAWSAPIGISQAE